MGPIARRDQFIITEAEQDLVIYDKRTCHLHTVPSPIAAVWRCCDGVRSVNEIAVAIGLPSPQVEAALHQLAAVRLIEGGTLATVPSHGRRRFVKRAGLGAAIVSVTAPMAAAAASVAPAGQCYWLDGSNVWTPMPVDYTGCRNLDSCFGGGDESMGGCYKWTASPDDPFTGWG